MRLTQPGNEANSTWEWGHLNLTYQDVGGNTVASTGEHELLNSYVEAALTALWQTETRQPKMEMFGENNEGNVRWVLFLEPIVQRFFFESWEAASMV